MKIRRKRFSEYLYEALTEQEPKSGQPYNKLLAKHLLSIAFDTEAKPTDRLHAMDIIMDRVDGKAIQTNVNAEVGPSPLEGIPTEVLEALREKAEALKKSNG